MNTQITWMYRDAHNFKAVQSIVVAGPHDETLVDQLIVTLDEGTYFVPELVGLVNPQEQLGEWNEDTDHPFCELDRSGIVATAAQPSDPMTLADLVDAFTAVADWHDFSKGTS